MNKQTIPNQKTLNNFPKAKLNPDQNHLNQELNVGVAQDKLTEQELKTLMEALGRGSSIRLLTGMSSEDLDVLYVHAGKLFEKSEFLSAKKIYVFLSRLNHWNFNYWFSAGLCAQRIGEYDEALFNFGQAGMLSLDDPRPPYMAGLCLQIIGKNDLAHKAFTAASRCCGSKADYVELKKEIAEKLGFKTTH